MQYEFHLDLDAIAQTAIELEQALIEIKEEYHRKGNQSYEPIADWLIYTMSPLITVCKNKEIVQPYNSAAFLVSRAGRDACDVIDMFDKSRIAFGQLCILLKGGMSPLVFSRGPYGSSDDYPEKMIPLLKIQAEEERKRRELKKQQNL